MSVFPAGLLVPLCSSFNHVPLSQVVGHAPGKFAQILITGQFVLSRIFAIYVIYFIALKCIVHSLFFINEQFVPC